MATFSIIEPLQHPEFSGLPHLEKDCVGYNFAHLDSFAVLAVLVFASAVFLVIIVTFTVWTHKLLKVSRVHLSRATVQEHRVVFLSLINTVTRSSRGNKVFR